MEQSVVISWIGEERVHAVPHLPHLTAELVQVSVFLAAFSGLYLTVSTVTDETYREHFFAASSTSSSARWACGRSTSRCVTASGPRAT